MIKRYIVKKLKDWVGWHQIKQDIYRIEGDMFKVKEKVSYTIDRVDDIDLMLEDYKAESDEYIVQEVTIRESQVHKLNEFLKGLGE